MDIVSIIPLSMRVHKNCLPHLFISYKIHNFCRTHLFPTGVAHFISQLNLQPSTHHLSVTRGTYTRAPSPQMASCRSLYWTYNRRRHQTLAVPISSHRCRSLTCVPTLPIPDTNSCRISLQMASCLRLRHAPSWRRHRKLTVP